jgi:hypothetical protein
MTANLSSPIDPSVGAKISFGASAVAVATAPRGTPDYHVDAARPRLSQDVLGAENDAGKSTMDGPEVPCPSAALCARPAHLYAKSTLTCGHAVAAITFCPAPKRTRLPTMSTIELVDPELRDALALWPQVSLTAETLTRRRADALALLSSVPTPDLPDIATGEIHVESAFGASPIRVLTYRPVRSDDPLPVIVHIHGGGFVMGTPEMKDVENKLFASELKCAIYSVDYRLSPEAPHPAPLEDIYSVFVWLHANAGQLGLDPAASVSRAKAEAAVSRRGPHFMPATGRDRNSPFST